MAKTNNPSLEEVKKKIGGAGKRSKKAKPPKHTPCWNAYKSSNRRMTNKIKQLKKHLNSHANDKQASNRLHSIEVKKSLV